MYKIVHRDNYLVIGDRVGNENSLFYNFPSFEKLSNGEWLVCCREIRGLTDPKGKIRLRRSSDGGKTWYNGIPPTCHDERDYPQNGFLICNITELDVNELLGVYTMVYTDESKPLFSPTSDGMQYTKIRTTKSFDNGKSWAKPKDIEYEAPDLLVNSGDKAVKFPDGSIGFTCETHDIWDEGFKEPIAAKFIKSYDRGYTFPEGNIIVSDSSMLYGDGRPTFNDKNELTIYFWSLYMDESHRIIKDSCVHRSKTTDNGKTWSKMSPINLNMQITSPLFLKKRLMVCICQDRYSEQPGLKALLSYDEGTNWDSESEITIFGANSRPDSSNVFQTFTQYKFGYSSIFKLSEKQCAVCYWHDNSVTTSVSVSIIDIVKD